jgi:hypothetical protein
MSRIPCSDLFFVRAGGRKDRAADNTGLFPIVLNTDLKLGVEAAI